MSLVKGLHFVITASNSNFIKAFKDADNKIKTLGKSISQSNRLLRIDPKNMDILKEKVLAAKERVKVLTSTMKELQAEIKRAGESGSYVTKLKKALDKVDMRLKSATLSADVFQKQLNKATPLNKFKQFGAQLESIRYTLIGMALPIYRLVTSITVPFEESIGKIKTITKGLSYENNKLTESIKNVARETGIAAEDIADGWYFLLSSGRKPTKDMREEIEFLTQASKLSIAGFGNMRETVRLAAGVMNAYGKDTHSATKVMDAFIKVQNSGITIVQEMAQFVPKVSPLASMLGLSLEDLSASVAVLTRSGLPTAKATTFLNRMLTDLAKSGSRVSKILKDKTGKSFKDLLGEGKGLLDILKILNKYVEETEDTELIDIFSSIRAASGALGLNINALKTYKNVLEDVKNSRGELDEAFSAQEPYRAFNKELNVLKTNLIDFGTGATAVVVGTLKSISSILKIIPPDLQKIIGGTLTFTLVAGLLLLALKKLYVVLKSLYIIKGLSFLFLGKFKLITLAVTGVVAAVVLLKDNLKGLFDWILSIPKNIWNFVTGGGSQKLKENLTGLRPSRQGSSTTNNNITVNATTNASAEDIANMVNEQLGRES